MKIPSRRAVLAGIAAAATPIAPALATTLGELPAQAAGFSSVDPIYAVIAEHRAAVESSNSISEKYGNTSCDDPEEPAAFAASKAASARADQLLSAVFTTQPTTLAGVAAILGYVGLPEFFVTEDESILSGANDSAGAEEARMFPLRLAATVRSMIGSAGVRLAKSA